MLSTADSPETYKMAIQTLRREADNRLESFKTGTADISARLANPQQPVQQLVQQPVQQQMPTQPPVQQQAPVQQKQKFTSSGW
jgi:ABC-type Fe2+-enterobactin transport system substrate-binding protein